MLVLRVRGCVGLSVSHRIDEDQMHRHMHILLMRAVTDRAAMLPRALSPATATFRGSTLC